MSISALRSIITNAGGTPTTYAHIPLLRQLITQLGGNPDTITSDGSFDYVGLIRRLIIQAGGTPTYRNPTYLLRQLVTTLGGTPATFYDDDLWGQVQSIGFFNPATLFDFYFNPAVAGSRYQSGTRAAPGTAAAADGDPIGLLLSQSSAAIGTHDLAQATAGKKPLYKTSGGKHWAQFDGVDDFLDSGAWATSQPFTRISSIRLPSLAASARLFGQNTGANTPAFAFDTNGAAIIFSGVSLQSANFAIAAGADITVTEVHNGASSKIRINGVDLITGDAGASVGAGFSIGGADFAATLYANARVYGVGIKQGSLLSAGQLSSAETFFTGLHP